MTPTTPKTPASSRFFMPVEDDFPLIDRTDTFTSVANKLSDYITKAVDAGYTYEQLRAGLPGQALRPLVQSLSEDCHHPALVAALLAAKYEFQSCEDDDGSGLSTSRGYACEIVAWQFLTYLSEKELIDYLLYELPETTRSAGGFSGDFGTRGLFSTLSSSNTEEASRLLDTENGQSGVGSAGVPKLRAAKRATFGTMTDSNGTLIDTGNVEAKDKLGEEMAGMNALEIAAIANAKKFLSQKPVQKIVDGIWSGHVIFWESLSPDAVKKPRTYNKRVADPFTRLRVPKYQKAFQIAFFLSFLALYYAVLVERDPQRVTIKEILLYFWIAAYAYDEFGELQDAGVMFYRIDFWSLWDVAIVGIGLAFLVARAIGLAQNSDYITDMAFDILSMIALFLVPRIFSVMSLNPYFGSLIPVLKEMTKTFIRFLPVILVLYLGFLTTFTMLARDRLTLNEMSWILVQVFFGSSYLGFDVAVKISPALGYPLMLIFVCLTNILLLTALVSLVSNSLTEVIAHAREEYLFQYSIYVLESSTSRRLTFFLPPLNLIPLLLLRPLRLVLPSETLRRLRIIVLKVTHVPFVALIWAYEGSRRIVSRGSRPPSFGASRALQIHPRPLSAVMHPSGLDRERDAPRTSDAHSIGRTRASSASHLSASNSTGFDNAAALLALVQKLSSQVDELTATIAGGQKD